jgi:ATPase family protein associated with various cellular activities (AAA)
MSNGNHIVAVAAQNFVRPTELGSAILSGMQTDKHHCPPLKLESINHTHTSRNQMDLNNELGGNAYSQAQYKKEKIEHHSQDDRFCTIFQSSSRAYSALQFKITEILLKNDKNATKRLYYGGYNEKKEIVYELIEGIEYNFDFDGNLFTATIETITANMATNMEIQNKSLLFLRATSRKIIEKFLSSFLVSRPTREIYQYSTESGIWRTVGVVKNRAPNTLILKEGVLNNLMDDVDDFIKSKKDYEQYGIPYKKVYLFHGEPGTGKTSLSQILAAKTDRSLYILSFDPKMTDDDLCSAIRRVDSKRGILLLEDIDCLFRQRNTNENLTSVSFSSLLNNLDGAITNVGLITIITTNHIEVLDAALRRPLRVDKTIKFEKADDQQIKRFFKLYEVQVSKKILKNIIRIASNANLCPAGVSAFLFRNRKNELSDDNIIDLFKEYTEEIKIEKDDNKQNSLYN